MQQEVVHIQLIVSPPSSAFRPNNAPIDGATMHSTPKHMRSEKCSITFVEAMCATRAAEPNRTEIVSMGCDAFVSNRFRD